MGTVEIAVLGLIGSVVTQLLKKLAKKVGGPAALLVAFIVVLIVAIIWSILREYAPVEAVEIIVGGFALAIAWYEVILKRAKIW